MRMDNVILTLPHNTVEFAAISEEMPALCAMDMNTTGIETFNFVLIKWMICCSCIIYLKPGLVSLTQKVHQLVFNAADVHGSGNNQYFRLSHCSPQCVSFNAMASITGVIRKRTGNVINLQYRVFGYFMCLRLISLHISPSRF